LTDAETLACAAFFVIVTVCSTRWSPQTAGIAAAAFMNKSGLRADGRDTEVR
jgi:hypothetical protein